MEKKSRIPAKFDPNGDGCGLIYVSPAVPIIPSEVDKAIQIIKRVINSYKFEPNMGINFISERLLYITVAIIYDRFVAGEDDRAKNCNKKLIGQLTQKGYFPYRLNTQSMNSLSFIDKSCVNLIKQLEKNLDPNDILAPGRYDFRNYW